MNVFTRSVGDTAVVELGGEVDLKGSPVVRKTLFDVLKTHKKVVLDLSQIRYIDSSGIAIFIEAMRESQRLEHPFVMFGLSQEVLDVFKLTHVMRIFQVVETEEQALRLEA